MKVRRISEVKFYEAAKAQHGEVIELHKEHVKRVRAENAKEKERHAARKRHNSETRARMRVGIRTRRGNHTHSAGMKMLHPESFQSQDELNAMHNEESIQPLLTESIPPPEVIPEPEKPEFQHSQPDVYDVLKVKDQMMEFVQGGYALRAMPGSYVLTNERTKEKFIITEDDLQTRFEKV
jgi:hypothetical protein